MYITQVELNNVRSIGRLVMDFEKLGSSSLVIGDNGDGKSTLLRSIAMGLCDESSAAALLRDLPGDFVRHGEKKATSKVTLASTRKVSYVIKTTIKSLEAFERVTQEVYKVSGGKKTKLSQNNFPWHRIFVGAYGAGTRTIGTADYNYYVPADAVYTLFMYKEPLQNPELIIRRLIETARERGSRRSQVAADKQLSDIKKLLATVLTLKTPSDTDLTSTGIKVRRYDEWTELGSMGDGYKSTVTWILDLLSWWFLYANKDAGWRIAPVGIVIIDEIEQHLHPRWQITIMDLIKKVFSRLQIIASTHSPLVMSGSRLSQQASAPSYFSRRGHSRKLVRSRHSGMKTRRTGDRSHIEQAFLNWIHDDPYGPIRPVNVQQHSRGASQLRHLRVKHMSGPEWQLKGLNPARILVKQIAKIASGLVTC